MGKNVSSSHEKGIKIVYCFLCGEPVTKRQSVDFPGHGRICRSHAQAAIELSNKHTSERDRLSKLPTIPIRRDKFCSPTVEEILHSPFSFEE